MSPIYKYTPEKYVDGFIRRGEILFRTLAYYKDYEEQQVRGDRYEGTRLHQKAGGLPLTMVESGQTHIFNGSLESNARTEDIFVLCLSTELSADLAHDFGTTTCIEIHDPIRLLAGIRSALKRRPSIKNETLLHRPVTYYNAGDNVGIEWAFPDRIAMSKTRDYEKQKEYRIAFGVNNALAFQNTTMRLVTDGHIEPRIVTNHRDMLLKVGDLRRSCTVWEFGPDGVPRKRA
ncbi:hypothetical protein [Herbaspirillum sp. SJZ107]|uniref:hypothetical protein n=1 Tax=Herbaspirillum sp. SJZ107 TaxID=2572881 RepID=UPI001154273B|nr:hypothetical protein [Herbaspirillum sp. SJZ107]TQK07006.1 hypothetical protein FBX97_2274 [Herbaspirillum sp. SJZ107]